MDYPFESQRELWEITEYKDGAIFRAEYRRDVWVGFGPGDQEEQPPPGFKHVSMANHNPNSPRRRRSP